MSKRFVHAFITALRAFHADWRTGLLRSSVRQPRAVWDNGIDYDTPAYLRRRVG